MPDYVQRPSGILVPRHPASGGGPRPLDAPGAGFGGKKKERREFLGGVTNPAWVNPGYVYSDLQTHIHGRIIAATQVMTNATFLRGSNWVRENDMVRTVKAGYQDDNGITSHPRAHRFPCNVIIGFRDIPKTAAPHSVPLAERMKLPFAVTDFLPRVFNYADELFEDSGAKESIAHAVRFALAEQPQNKPVNPNLVRHTVTHILMPGFQLAYQRAYETACRKDNPLVPKISITDPGFTQAMTTASLDAEYDENRPTLDIETVQDILFMSVKAAGQFVPVEAQAAEIQREVDALQNLARG